MQDNNGKPWDARLIEWMQRGSDTAESMHWSQQGRAIYVLVYVAVGIILGGWFYYAAAGLAVLTGLVFWQRDRGKR